MTDINKVGSEIVIHDTSANNPQGATVAGLLNGGFVVSWIDFGDAAGDNLSIRAQVFNANGVAQTSDLLVNTVTDANQGSPTVTALANGGFVVAWDDFSGTLGDSDASSVKAQMFDADGVKQGVEFLVNTSTALNQGFPTITALASGGFVAAWSDLSGTLGDSDFTSIKAQIFGTSGEALGSEFLVNTETASYQGWPSIAGLPDGGFVVTWQDSSGNSGGNFTDDIKAQVYFSSGEKNGGEILVNTETTGAQTGAKVLALSNNTFVITWSDNSLLSSDVDYSITAQMFDTDGAKLGSEFKVNTLTDSERWDPSIGRLPNDGFVITWTDYNQPPGDTSGAAIMAQAFDGNGTKQGGAFIVNTETLGDQGKPMLTSLAHSGFAVTWFDANSTLGPEYMTLRAQVFASDAPPVIASDGGSDPAALSIAENTVAVTTVAASGSAVTYSIAGGADAALFQIDVETGALTFKAAPDFEAPGAADANNLYQVIVLASDGVQTDSQAIAVTITDANEAPIITSNGGGAIAALSTAENETYAVSVEATDVDAGATIRYGIIGGADADLFQINKVTGALSFKSAPDFEAAADADGNNVYDVIVAAGDRVQGDTQAISVTVTNANEAPAIFTNGGAASASFSISENGKAVTRVGAADADGGTKIAYSIVSGADAALFQINASTGALSFKVAPDFEAPDDADANNVYDVVVQAGDGSLSDTQSIAITVTNAVDERLVGTLATDTLTGAGGNDTLKGREGDDILAGGDGDDRLDGGAGADRMDGGAGNDVYFADDAADLVTELAGLGIDTVKSGVDWVLGDNIETLVLTGSTDLTARGNTAANTIAGNGGANMLEGAAGSDRLFGGSGNDWLAGGDGRDVLTGGAGNDVFVFDTAPAKTNLDRITDFNFDGRDEIALSQSVYTGLGRLGVLTADAFYSNAGARSAHDASDRVVYDTVTGKLYYDSDGTGGHSAVQIAVLGTAAHPALSYADFEVIA